MKKTIATVAVLATTAAGAASVALAAAHAADHAKVTVAPTKGTPSTKFTVRFKSLGPASTTTEGGLVTDGYRVSVTGPSSTGCVTSATKSAAPAAKGTPRHVVLNPSRFAGGRWCSGKFTGSVAELKRPVCQPGKACPQFIVSYQVGDFSFRVSAGG